MYMHKITVMKCFLKPFPRTTLRQPKHEEEKPPKKVLRPCAPRHWDQLAAPKAVKKGSKKGSKRGPKRGPKQGQGKKKREKDEVQ